MSHYGGGPDYKEYREITVCDPSLFGDDNSRSIEPVTFIPDPPCDGSGLD